MAERRVLLIDSDPSFQELLVRSLAPFGVQVHVVDDGTDGLGHVPTLEPEVIFISVELPDKVGYSTCNKAKKGVARKIPVVLTTSTVPPTDLAQHRKLKVHADEYIDKRNVTADEIVRKIDGLVSLGAPLEDVPIEELPVEAEDIHFEELSVSGPAPLSFHTGHTGHTGDRAAGDTHVASVNHDSGDTGVAGPHGVDPGIDAETDAVFAGLVDSEEPVVAALATGEHEISGVFEEPSTRVRGGARGVNLPPPLPAPPVALRGAADSEGLPEHDATIDLAAATLPRVAELEAALARTQRELEEARRAPAAPAATAFSREREVLGLREVINRKEKEILDLREEVDAKDRVILGGKDKVRELDRKLRDHDEKLLTFEGNLVTANEQVAALRDDKDKALEREKGLKARIDIAQAQLRKADEEYENLKKKAAAEITALSAEVAGRKRDLEAEKKAGQDKLTLAEATHAAALKKAGDEHGVRVATLKREHEQERDEKLAALRADHEGAREKARVASEGALAALRAEKDQALGKADKDRKADVARLETERAQALAAAEAQRQAELQAAEVLRANELAAAAERHRAAVAEAKELGQLALEGLRANKDDHIARLTTEGQQAAAAAEERRQRELATAASKHRDEQAALEERRQREVQTADERRMKELLTADAKRREEVASAEERRQRELAAAEERRQRELAALDDKHTRDLGALTQAHEEALGTATSAHTAEAGDLRAEIGKLEGALGQTRARLGQVDGDLTQTQATLREREGALAHTTDELADRERRLEQLRAAIADLEKENASFQEQLLKAYQKIKSDEAIANKAKKAMAIALTLLDGEPRPAGDEARSGR
jgi:CheY-like chemotaxis protein